MIQNLDLPSISLFETLTGKYFLPNDTTDDIIIDIKENRVYNDYVVNEILTRAKSDSVILDLGSNFGQMTVLFSQFLGADGLVISVESNPWIYYALSKTVVINQCKNVRLINAAIWDTDGDEVSLDFDNCIKYGSYGSYGAVPNKSDLAFKSNTITVDSLNLPKVDFMKIDVQGADLLAMKGARHTIERCKPVIIFEYESSCDEMYSTNWQEYLEFIDQIGYKIEKTLDVWNANWLILPK